MAAAPPSRYTRLTVEIEHCVDCEDHLHSTHHDGRKYEEYAKRVQEAISHAVNEQLVFLVNPPPDLGRRGDLRFQEDRFCNHFYVIRDITGMIVRKFRYPQIGAFEVYLHNPFTNQKLCVFSKLAIGRWPNPEIVAKRIQRALNSGPSISFLLFSPFPKASPRRTRPGLRSRTQSPSSSAAVGPDPASPFGVPQESEALAAPAEDAGDAKDETGKDGEGEKLESPEPDCVPSREREAKKKKKSGESGAERKSHRGGEAAAHAPEEKKKKKKGENKDTDALEGFPEKSSREGKRVDGGDSEGEPRSERPEGDAGKKKKKHRDSPGASLLASEGEDGKKAKRESGESLAKSASEDERKKKSKGEKKKKDHGENAERSAGSGNEAVKKKKKKKGDGSLEESLSGSGDGSDKKKKKSAESSQRVCAQSSGDEVKKGEASEDASRRTHSSDEKKKKKKSGHDSSHSTSEEKKKKKS